MSRLKLSRVLRWLAGSAEDHQNALMATRMSLAVMATDEA